MIEPVSCVATTDYHTAGEPFRIVTAGAPDLPGVTVAERRERAIGSEQAQRIRRLLCHEPRGHADMYGCFVVPPDDAGAALGVLFWHKDGFSTACGHGTIALATWAVQTGVVGAYPDGDTEVRIDVPSGRVAAVVRCIGGAVADVTFRNVPSFVLHRGARVALPRGAVTVDVSFGGAIYASLPASAVELSVVPEAAEALTVIGRKIKWAVQRAGLAEHPTDPRLSGCYGITLYDDLVDAGPPVSAAARAATSGTAGSSGLYQRSVTVFADGEVDRSPCGSGTSARMAILHAQGSLAVGEMFTHESIIGTRFTARITETVDERSAVITEIVGRAYRTGEHRFELDLQDDLGTGFVLR